MHPFVSKQFISLYKQILGILQNHFLYKSFLLRYYRPNNLTLFSRCYSFLQYHRLLP
jgi:hypothetical protein